MLHICTEFEQLNGLIVPLTEDYVQNIAIHVCKMRHRDVICCEDAEMMHDGSHPNITIIYIPPELEPGVRIIISQLRANFRTKKQIMMMSSFLLVLGLELHFHSNS